MSGADQRLWVVVPFYNEARWITGTLRGLATQSDLAFEVVLVDNASTDETVATARTCLTELAPPWPWTIVQESRKGTGAASDCGFRYAIAHGATHIARVDADCVPDRDWVRTLKHAFGEDHLEFVAGKIRPRADDVRLSSFDRVLMPLLIDGAEVLGRLHRRGPRFKYPYILAVGSNLAITSELYISAGGFPRRSIEEVHEDRALAEAVRQLTPYGGVRADAIVYSSARRAKRYGYWRTALWYIAHWCRPTEVDVR
jgi:glycosyltransferase involved in cell wall biosynthesis